MLSAEITAGLAPPATIGPMGRPHERQLLPSYHCKRMFRTKQPSGAASICARHAWPHPACSGQREQALNRSYGPKPSPLAAAWRASTATPAGRWFSGQVTTRSPRYFHPRAASRIRRITANSPTPSIIRSPKPYKTPLSDVQDGSQLGRNRMQLLSHGFSTTGLAQPPPPGGVLGGRPSRWVLSPLPYVRPPTLSPPPPAPGAPPARARRVARSYPRAVAVFGRSSIRTWLNSVLSLCAPHWGQRSADDQAPHRWHALCVRFGTTSLPVHRCRIFHFLEHPNAAALKRASNARHRI